MKMKIIAHDEDSLSNLFFSEVSRLGKTEDFVNLIVWRDHKHHPFNVKDTILHQQLNLSEFGKPDAIIVCTDTNGKKHIVIVEAKLKDYIASSDYNLEGDKFNNKINSRLNNQLTLRYRAFKVLSSISQKGFLSESEHVSESPYSEDKVRRCKKKATLDVLRDFASNDIQFYLVVLTNDASSPFDIVDKSHRFYPLFYDAQKGIKEDFPNLGYISWEACNSLFEGVDNHFYESYKRMKLHAFDEAESTSEDVEPSDLTIKGGNVVEMDGVKSHLSCKKYSYALRGVKNGRLLELDRGVNDKEKYLQMANNVIILEKATEPIHNEEYWIKKLGESYVSPKVSKDDLFVKGRQIVLYNGKLCHLSCQGYSYAIRYFEDSRFVELDRGIGDRDKYLSLKNKIEIIEKAPRERVENSEFWEKYFNDLQKRLENQ